MKNSTVSPSSQGPAFWDIFVLKEDGRWLGIRAPWASFRRVMTLLTVLFALSATALTGWLLSRWQSGRLDRLLSLERLKSVSLENQLADLRKSAPGGTTAKIDTSAVSVLPALGEEELATGVVGTEGVQVGYDPVAREFRVNFELVKQGPRDAPSRFHWLLLIHGSQGMISFPPAFASRAGEAIQFHRGQVVEDVKIRRSVSARFKVNDFFENAGTEPVYATLLIYDTKGSLILRKRQTINFQRAAEGAGGER